MADTWKPRPYTKVKDLERALKESPDGVVAYRSGMSNACRILSERGAIFQTVNSRGVRVIISLTHS